MSGQDTRTPLASSNEMGALKKLLIGENVWSLPTTWDVVAQTFGP